MVDLQRKDMPATQVVDNRGVLVWPLAALSLAFRCSEIFLWRALQC